MKRLVIRITDEQFYRAKRVGFLTGRETAKVIQEVLKSEPADQLLTDLEGKAWAEKVRIGNER